MDPKERLDVEQALDHPYFEGLPQYRVPDDQNQEVQN